MTTTKTFRPQTTQALPVLRPNAAGIDIASREIFVAVPHDRSQNNVRAFPTFTCDLHRLADWLQECHIDTVVIESTSHFWLPLFQILTDRGLEVYLVNAQHAKNVAAHKTDVCDCQWLQYLHACGLLRASFRPEQAVCVVRALLRHRDNLLEAAASQVQQMQNVLNQMNLHLHHVISDLTGKTGLAILDAILAGERDPHQLAQHRDYRIKASQELIAKSLEGDWRDELLFVLRQALATWRHSQQQITDCDHEIQRRLAPFEARIDVGAFPLPPTKTRTGKQPQRNELRFAEHDLRTEMYRLFGVDLCEIPGLQSATAYTLFAELGRDLKAAFPTCGHFCSWLGLCPNNQISGGKILSTKTRKVKNRVALALRMCAQSLHHSQSALGDFYRRMRSRLGAPKAITATAHKLARILYHMITTQQPYDETASAQNEQRYQKKRLRKLEREAAAFGYTLTPTTPVS